MINLQLIKTCIVVAIMKENIKPPILGICHERIEILFDRFQIERLEFGRVIKTRIHGVGQIGILMEHLDAQLIRPPGTVVVGASRGGLLTAAMKMRKGAFAAAAVVVRIFHENIRGDLGR